MKSYFLAIVTAVSFCSVASAQGFHVGAKVGANINKLSGQAFKDQFTYGYHAGAYAEIPISKKWRIQPEVLFNQSNYDTSAKFSQLYEVNATKISNIKLNYISIPLLLSYRPSKILTLQAGPKFGVLIDRQKNLFQNGKDAFKQGDFSLLGGAQLNLGGLRIYGRYTIGLNNINDIDNKDQWKSQGFQVGIGLNIL